MSFRMIFGNGSLWILSGLALLLAGCGPVSDAWMDFRDESSADNHMMLVRKEPGTLGYRRLMSRSVESGDLRVFIDQTGLPDFLAEANSSERRYLILYYLDRHQAYACRTRGRNSAEVEFAGPYAMTAGELKLLRAAKRKANEAVARR